MSAVIRAYPSPLERISKRLRDGHARATQGGQEWIEGSLEVMAALLEGRDAMPANLAFSAWLKDNGLDFYNRTDRAALLSLAADSTIAREALTKSKSRSYQMVWREFADRYHNNMNTTRRERHKVGKKSSLDGEFAELHRKTKLDADYARIANTSLDHPREKDALIGLKDHHPTLCQAVIERAVRGDAVSAVAEVRKLSREPPATVAQLIAEWKHSHKMLAAWQHAEPAARRAFIHYLTEQDQPHD